MRLLEAEVYRGKQIRIYIVHSFGVTYAATPTLGVRIDGKVIDNQVTLPGIFRLGDALEWGHSAVDRLLTGRTGKPARMPTPV